MLYIEHTESRDFLEHFKYCVTHAMATKRKREEVTDDFKDLSMVTNTSPNARVSRLLTDLSPMKKGKGGQYFHGELTDNKGAIRVYGFDTAVRKSLFECYEKMSLLNYVARCQVKFAKIKDTSN